MIDIEKRVEIAKGVRVMTNEELLESFKDVDRKCRNMVVETVSYQSNETFNIVRELSELEYERKMIVDRIIGKAVE